MLIRLIFKIFRYRIPLKYVKNLCVDVALFCQISEVEGENNVLGVVDGPRPIVKNFIRKKYKIDIIYTFF